MRLPWTRRERSAIVPARSIELLEAGGPLLLLRSRSCPAAYAGGGDLYEGGGLEEEVGGVW